SQTLKRERAFLLVFAASAYLSLAGLSQAALWDDEAEVAIFGRNLLHTGTLTAWDGRNLFAYASATTLDAEMHSRQPPLMFLVTALSFKLFGVSNGSARVLFVLCGLVALVVFRFVLRRELGQTPHAEFYAFADRKSTRLN